MANFKLLVIACALLGMPYLAQGCGRPRPRPPPPPRPSHIPRIVRRHVQDPTELSRATTSFGLNLYRHIASRDPQANVLFSPLSVFTALSMTLLGAEAETERQLKSVLAVSDQSNVHSALHAAFASFPTSPDSNVTLKVANGLYYNNTQVSLAEPFKTALRDSYGVAATPFQEPNAEGPINDWVSQATAGKIRDFLTPGFITNETILLLLNALYFQGTWRNVFDVNRTYERSFTTGSGDVIMVQMMSRDGGYAVKGMGNGLAGRVLELPYGSDGRFSLFVILPDSVNNLTDIERGLTEEVLEATVTNMPSASRYTVSLPKFSLRSKQSLKDILQDMGLSRLFQNAQLSRMVSGPAPVGLAVGKVVHEAVIEVDETGTRAAAVTAVEVGITSLPPSFTVDRPFLVVLRDNRASLNLFLGRVNRPEALTGA